MFWSLWKSDDFLACPAALGCREQCRKSALRFNVGWRWRWWESESTDIFVCNHQTSGCVLAWDLLTCSAVYQFWELNPMGAPVVPSPLVSEGRKSCWESRVSTDLIPTAHLIQLKMLLIWGLHQHEVPSTFFKPRVRVKRTTPIWKCP